MIHDSLLILWDCSTASQKEPNDIFTSECDKEMYGRICDIARCHHKIQNFVAATGFQARNTQRLKSSGLYAQALSEGITDVLQQYKETLLEVESLVLNNHTYTLSFVFSHVERFRGLFNTLSRIICMIRERRLVGCQILSLVHQHILNGNEIVHDAIIKIFSHMYGVLTTQLCAWLLAGELRDPYREFFVTAPDAGAEPAPGASPSDHEDSLMTTLHSTVTESGYGLNSSMIPYFVPLSLAQEILFIGKTVILFSFEPRNNKKGASMSFFPQLESDSRRFTIWDDKEAEFHETLQNLSEGKEFDINSLKKVVRDIKECVTKHLWTIAVEEAGLLQELQLVKEFFLLGRGELFLELLRLAAPVLDAPVTRTSTRDMNQAFQLAARGVQADAARFSLELPHARERTADASARSADSDSSSVSDGWSCVVLKFKLRWPLHLVFSPPLLARYNDLFRLLLRIKRAQHDLHALWKTCRHRTSTASWQLHRKLMFVLDNLQLYLQADVLETGAAALARAVAATRDFDVACAAHKSFLADVLRESFLCADTPELDPSPSGPASPAPAPAPASPAPAPALACVLQLLALSHEFCHGERDDYCLRGHTERFNSLMSSLLRSLAAARGAGGGAHLARLLVRLDFNRWLSAEARLTASVTNMMR